jgi:hypothetical protein
MLSNQFCKLNQFLILSALVFLAGCSSNEYPLSEREKANMVAELISNTKECAAFKDKLAPSDLQSSAIDAVYFDATKAGCIKKDI